MVPISPDAAPEMRDVRRRFALFAFLLAGCAPDFAPPGDRHMTPVVADDAIVARDGTRLPLRRWEAEGAPRAVIVALHGMSDYSNAFDMPAKVWAKPGITTIAYDQRGFGRSDNPGLWAGAEPCAPTWTTRWRRRGRVIPACRSLRWAKAWAGRWC